ncbi:MAG: metallophosphoesterase [Draconibacterium sp.]
MKKTGYLLLLVASAFILGACNSNDDDIVANPFDTIGEANNNERNKIVVISDLHMGNDLSYSENVKHLQRLEQFLNEVRSSATIKELVIGGDMFDEWYVPTRVDAYGGGSQAYFVRKTVAANQGVFDILNGIIKDSKIKLTYVPGNHDMGFTSENVNIAMPGVNQARDTDNEYAVGTYHPDDYPEIAIEHGHRYDFFCCATPNANETEAPGATLPPGYFFARIAANSFTDPTTIEAATKAPAVKLNNAGNAEQYSKYVYYNVWKKVLDSVIYVKDNFSDPIIKTNVGNYTKTYAINDILPYNSSTDGSIKMNLYNGLFTQENWDERQKVQQCFFSNEINGSNSVGSLKPDLLMK